jgi:hypothetical protein
MFVCLSDIINFKNVCLFAVDGIHYLLLLALCGDTLKPVDYVYEFDCCNSCFTSFIHC